MEFLNIKSIINIIKDYITEDIYNYAIMIDGDWGSGKTYFIKEVLIPKIEASGLKRAIYVSLYGLKCTEEISNSIFSSIVESRMGKGKKMLPVLNSGIKFVAEYVGNKLGSKTIGDLDKDILSPFLSYNDYYFIFDDLERCSMPVNEVMGYINHFLEQNSAKVLIVTNEKEVGSVEIPENNYLKYQIAAHDSIKWPERKKEDSFWLGQAIQGAAKQADIKPDLDEIKRRSKLLSEENTFYFKVKEKLVGQTIYYRPALQDVVPIIFNRCIGNVMFHNDFQRKSIEKICSIMEAENYFNLRTMQFALMFFKKISAEISCDSNSKTYETVLSEVLNAIIKVTISYKQGDIKYQWEENSEYGTINLKGSWSSYYYFTSFKFIHDYIYYGVYNSEHIQVVLRLYVEKISSEEVALSDPTTILGRFWEMDDEEIETNLRILFENLKTGKYKGSSYRWILSLLFKLKGVGFEPIPIDNYVKIMRNNIIKGESIDTLQQPIIEKGDSTIDDYVTCLESLRANESDTRQLQKVDTLNEILNIDFGWGEKFYNYCLQNRDTFLSEHGFFSYINVDKCFAAIDRSSVKDVNEFRVALSIIYNFTNLKDYYSEDTPNINKLYSMIEKNYDKKMKQYCIKLLREDMESILARLGKDVS